MHIPPLPSCGCLAYDLYSRLAHSHSHSLTLTHSSIIETAGARSSQQSKRAATQRRRLLRFLLLLRFARSRAGALPRP